MRIRLQHETRYSYDAPVALGPHVVRLCPAEHALARVLSFNLTVEPRGEVRWQHDPWGNRVARLTFDKEQAAAELRLVVDAAFDIRPVNPFDFFVDDRCVRLPFAYPDGLTTELAPFLTPPAATPQLTAFAGELPAAGHPVDHLVALNRRVAERVRYIIRAAPGIQRSEETLALGSGSCRDSARLLVDVLRAQGLAARFVSGYLVQLADEGIIPDLAKGVERDVFDLHAWAEVFIPGGGWVGLDGTSGLLCGEGHIPLACAVTPDLAAPISGTTSRPATRFTFAMNIERLGHEPRPRQPYTAEQWAAVAAAGDAVDAALLAGGVQLTSGGEPTWTSREQPREPEWITEALGPTKWTQGLRLARELRRRFGSGTLAMQTMGKHYPGESLPRWALHLIWREDGVPVWRDAALLDFHAHLPGTPHAAAADHAALEQALAAAERLGAAIARRLDVPALLHAGHEDAWHFIREEQDLPEDVDPLAADLDAPEERRRLARVLARGLNRPAGYALPLRRGARGAWVSCPWTFRRGAMVLLPGDSPMGLRLPLDRLAGAGPPMFVADVTVEAGPLGFDPRRERCVGARAAGAGQPQQEQAGTRPGAVLRSALCVEPRDGALHVFLPPVDHAADFLELVAAVEDAAAELGQPVRLEGYVPPSDPRLRACRVAPDPGVLEVNIPVAESFREYRQIMETVADAANHAGLCTEKYQLDGREVGSGGGNHITLGGPTIAASPFLSRPQLLASLIRYLQQHPALSFLFTGLFVGPTSQAPRIDEARHDALYELELALRQIPDDGGGAPPFPWTVDRLLRNLLVDVSGNVHRAELSIDKLYSPTGPAGRLGLVELRAFEMPPHERLAAAQMLLARALIARFVREPCSGGLVRWGTELHDRFLLPYYLWADFEDVAADLRRVGLPFDAEWYRPFLDHRCPVHGTLQLDDLTLELRAALEPWPVLGEETAGPLVARYVDASLDRLQVMVRGLTPERHVVAVNGVRLPLRATGAVAEAVGGVRFRAWQPPHCLHPNIPVHHPLRFDVVDTWARRALGACTYHVIHPTKDRGYAAPPLTTFEAAARRAQRFTTHGHAPWPVELREAPPHPEHPFTLDLRASTVSGVGEPLGVPLAARR